jgi:hypothetical protein
MRLESSQLRVYCSALTMSAVLCALSVAAIAQEPQEATLPNPTIRANVPLVLVPVTVTDRKGKFVNGLSVEDFIVGDNGIRQKIRLDTSDTVVAPVSLVVAVQCSPR